MDKPISFCNLSGSIQIPSSKSDGQRALLCAGLGKGTSLIKNVGNSDDESSMLSFIQTFGAQVKEIHSGLIEITGNSNPNFSGSIQLGESGLGLRLITPMVCISKEDKELAGEGSLTLREHSFFDQFLPQMGVTFYSNSGKLPFQLSGEIINGNYEVDGSQSSQYISGLLMTLPLASGDTTLLVKNLASAPYVEMTLNTLEAFGICIEHDNLCTFNIPGNQHYVPIEYTVESDWSSASYWLTAAALGHPVAISGLNLESSQADKSMLKALENAGCKIQIQEELIIEVDELRPFEFDATDCPDLFPALVCLASFIDGKTSIKGVLRLANKESDRGEVLKLEFGKLGVEIELNNDEMIIHGKGGILDQDAILDSHNDHRIAMCLAIAATKIQGNCIIRNAESVAKSYPSFWEDLKLMSQGDR